MSDKIQQDQQNDQLPGSATGSRRISRRDLLKRSAVSMPMVLTLQSGAALARSSNLISSTATDYNDELGRTLCLDTESVFPIGETGEVFDLGAEPYARVTAINDRDYRAEPNGSAVGVSEAQLCQSGGPAYVQNADFGEGTVAGWSEVRAPKGVLVSATALSSFAGSIQINDL